MAVDLSLSVLVEAPDAPQAEEVVTVLVGTLGEVVATRHAVVDYPKFPGSWLAVVLLAPMTGDDASAAVTSLANRLGPQGWSFEILEPLHASARWDDRSPDAGVLVRPEVTWAHLLASWHDPDEEPAEFEELVPDEPAEAAVDEIGNVPGE